MAARGAVGVSLGPPVEVVVWGQVPAVNSWIFLGRSIMCLVSRSRAGWDSSIRGREVPAEPVKVPRWMRIRQAVRILLLDMGHSDDGPSRADGFGGLHEVSLGPVTSVTLCKEGSTGIYAHIRQPRCYLEGSDATIALVRPFSWDRPLTCLVSAPIASYRDPCSGWWALPGTYNSVKCSSAMRSAGASPRSVSASCTRRARREPGRSCSPGEEHASRGHGDSFPDHPGRRIHERQGDQA
jgi:hypothetical protein